MRLIDADFNDLGPGGLVRVLLQDAADLHEGERVVLIEEAESMELEAVVREVDVQGGFVYFDLEWERASDIRALGVFLTVQTGGQRSTSSSPSSRFSPFGSVPIAV